ncbi:MAG: hypothetical protein PHN51_10425 [Candidatus Nanopelagicales bacterium]|nr:hypothetical protein [Candidatus Nanopelagicales bacterium]
MSINKQKHSLGLPLEYVYKAFLSGEALKPELLQRVYETYTLNNRADYVTEMQCLRNQLANWEHGSWKNEVYTVRTGDYQITPAETMLLIRYINIFHHGQRTIIVNDDLVYVTEKLAEFPDNEIMDYLNFRLNQIQYYRIGKNAVKEQQMFQYPTVESETARQPVYPSYHPKAQKPQGQVFIMSTRRKAS